MLLSRSQKATIILLRLAVGWFFMYAGFVAFTSAGWSLIPQIKQAEILPQFYSTVATPTYLVLATYAVKTLYVLAGLFIFLGIFVRIGCLIGIGIMVFFYLPLLNVPYVSGGYYLVDYHIIMISALLFLFAIRAGDLFGIGSRFRFSTF
jgi:uncharacterized membrane protein YphA (DoxX/SURF4 family)